MKMVDFALEQASLGRYVFPCRSSYGGSYVTKGGVKRELLPKQPFYKNGLHIATTDSNQIKAWWKRTPDAAIGLNCGKSNLFAVDVDRHGKVDGVESFKKLSISTDGALLSLTPTGGIHVVYDGVGRTTSNVNTGLDTRSIGGFIIIPPSFLVDNDGSKKYYVAKSDWTKKPSPIPSDLFDKLGIDERERNPPKERVNVSLSDEMENAKKALGRLPDWYVEDYHKWIYIGIILKNTFGDDGYELWDRWSRKSDKYDEPSCEFAWEKIEPRGDVRISSLFHHAYKRGQQ